MEGMNNNNHVEPHPEIMENEVEQPNQMMIICF